MSDDKVLVSREILERIHKDQAVSVAILDQLRMLLAQPSDGALGNDAPTGAIVNGAAFMDRVEANYEFRDQYGHLLANCSDWQDARRCFEHLAEYAARQPLTNEGAEPVAWSLKIEPRLELDDRLTEEQKSSGRWSPLYRHPPKTCTCPSGDGSLRWPCPVHPPESEDAQIAAGPWHEGAPSNPWDSEQFLAQMRDGLIYVLRPLPKNHTYDFTTADATYVLRKDISYWAQLSGSNYIPPEPVHLPEVKALVLPGRIEGRHHGDPIAEAQAYGWNACREQVKELNS